jgi:hypothetical protein
LLSSGFVVVQVDSDLVGRADWPLSCGRDGKLAASLIAAQSMASSLPTGKQYAVGFKTASGPDSAGSASV